MAPTPSSSRAEPLIERADSTSPDAAILIAELSSVLAKRYGSDGRDGFVPELEHDGVFLVARVDGDLAGCGAVRAVDGHERVAEIKRMYSRPTTRGVGSAILAELESVALELGFDTTWLETRRANRRAVDFYLRHGYRERAAYGKYVGRPEAICLEKQLADEPASDR